MKTGNKEDFKKEFKEVIELAKQYEKETVSFIKKWINEDFIEKLALEDVEVNQMADEWELVQSRIRENL